MANSLDKISKLYTLDGPGIISTTPICVSRVVYVPSAAADDLVFKMWQGSTTLAAGCKSAKTGTITGTNTLTSTGNLPSTIVDGSVFQITNSSGAAANIGYHVVETAGNTNAVVIHGDDWTNESDKVYGWKNYTTYNAIVLKAGAADASAITIDFDEGGTGYRRFPNLTLETIDGGTAYLYIA